LTVKAQLGVSFATKDGLLASILRSGVMVIEGAANEEDALRFYRELIVHKIGIPWSRIRW
jgi:hypothetical protein